MQVRPDLANTQGFGARIWETRPTAGEVPLSKYIQVDFNQNILFQILFQRDYILVLFKADSKQNSFKSKP